MSFELDSIRQFIRDAHDGQKRKFSGKTYVVHPLRVGDMIQDERDDRTLTAAGYLHDVLEDTDKGPEDVRDIANDDVLTIVEHLTHDSDYNNKVQAIAHSLGNHRDARLVKLYDRLDNVSHLDQASDEFVERYTQETGELLNWYDNSGTNEREKDLIARIKSVL